MAEVRAVKVGELELETPLPDALYHPSGELLHARANKLKAAHVELMNELGMGQVFLVPPECIADFTWNCEYDALRLGDLKIGDSVDIPLVSREGKPMVQGGTVITEKLHESLQRRAFATVYRPRPTATRHIEQAQEYLKRCRLQSFGKVRDDDPVEEVIDPTKIRTREEKARAIQTYTRTRDLVESVFEAIRDGKDVDDKMVASLVEDVIASIMKDRYLQTHLVNLKSKGSYMTGHSINVAILCANMAVALKLAPQEVKDLTSAGLFQKVGMMRIPQEILSKPGTLTQEERFEVEKHIVYGLNYLERTFKLPPFVILLISQVHERLDGSGYPKGRKKANIHPHSQIVSIADIYDALTSPRPWRKAHMPYDATAILLKMVADKKLDSDMVRHFVSCNSLFPIGSFVELSDNRVGRVIAAGSKHFTRPTVRIFEPEKREWGVIVDLSDAPDDLKVKRAVDGAVFGISALDGF